MASLAFVFPLRAGKTEEWRAWIAEILGPRRSEYEAFSFKLPKERLAKVTTPTLVIDGGTTPWLSHTAEPVPHWARSRRTGACS